MKTTLFITLLSISSFCTILYSQNYKTLDETRYICHYTYEYQQDSISQSNTKVSDMVLLIGNKYSQFSHNSTPIKDSLLLAYKNEEPSTAAMKILPHLMGNAPTFFTSYKVIKSIDKKQCTLYEKVVKTNLKVDFKTDFNWQLVPNSKKEILGLQCICATTTYAGRKYTAWYASEIPISEGPYVFNGLPGLIIKLQDSQLQHTFELSSFEPINFDKAILLEDENFLEGNFQTYQKAKRGDIEERIQRYSNPQNLQVNPTELGKIEAKLRSRNNFIERL